MLQQLAGGRFGPDPTHPAESAIARAWTNRLRLILASALQVDKAIFFSAVITVAAFVPLFTMEGVEGQIFNPMAQAYGLALAGALLATFIVTPVLTSYLLPERVAEAETFVVRALRGLYTPLLHWALTHRRTMVAFGVVFLAATGLLTLRLGSEFLPQLEEVITGFGRLYRRHRPWTLGNLRWRRCAKFYSVTPEVDIVTQHGRPDNGSDASPTSNGEISCR